MHLTRSIAILLAFAASASFGQSSEYKAGGPPPGELEGQRPPLVATPMPPPRPPQSNASTASIYVRNASADAMWVGFRPRAGGPAPRAMCVEPGSDARVEVESGKWTLNIVALDAGCVVRLPPKCNVMFRTESLAVQIDGGPSCAARDIAPPPPGLKSAGSQGNLTTRNDAQTPIWVTIYRPGGIGRVITASGCVQPGQEAKWSARPHLQMQNFWVRAEYMPRGDCGQPPRPSCDTTMQLRAWKYRNHENDYRVTFKATGPKSCWWDNPYQ